MGKFQDKRESPSAGFTLVELAIVMTIIGLLISGVLKGQELINQARIRATIAQANGIRTAIVTFQDKYDQLPGDFSKATERLPGCQDIAMGGTCGDGNSNTIIEPVGSLGILSAVTSVAGVTVAPNYERALFWKHLALADLITDVNPQADLGNPAWGITHPSSYFAGGIHIGHLGIPCIAPGLGCISGLSTGHYLTFRNSMFGGVNTLQPGQGAVTPGLGMAIDRKIDNGVAHSGIIVIGGLGGPPNGPVCGPSAAGPFPPVAPDETYKGRDCALFYYIGN